ncbi:DUF4148 domain-containing protein [Paraburkholderia sp.]|uniref:DUF4148 domain-containing protein n=1 Tax=Paraburkholderia sp. TaxID=1926495 RepID=UPI0039E5FE03
MKTTIVGILGIGLLVTPLLSHAQASTRRTHAEVRAELVQLEKAGYNPARRDDATYPANIQAAEARVSARNPAATDTTTAYGGTPAGKSESDRRTSKATSDSLYGHH